MKACFKKITAIGLLGFTGAALAQTSAACKYNPYSPRPNQVEVTVTCGKCQPLEPMGNYTGQEVFWFAPDYAFESGKTPCTVTGNTSDGQSIKGFKGVIYTSAGCTQNTKLYFYGQTLKQAYGDSDCYWPWDKP